ncbi:MAG TPA: ribosomal protein L7/L12 [Anaerolineae bacterium]|nr:ribosomal protein L7/L12 [Anaerolineae bacterium]
MPGTFHCPNCNGPLEYAAQEPVTECRFCGSAVVVPESLRGRPVETPTITSSQAFQEAETLVQIMAHLQAGRKIEAIKLYRSLTGQGLKEAKEAVEQLERGQPVVIHSGPIQTSSIQVKVSPETAKTVVKAGTGMGCLVTLFVIGLILVTVGLPLYFAFPELRQGADSLLALSTPTPQPTATPTPTPFAQLSLAFGQKGGGPGYFNDARSMSLDPQGRVFVGDYSPGRIQAFEADGSFLWQHLTTDQTDYIVGLAADLEGHLYALVGRDIHVLAADTGALIAEWQPAPDQVGWYKAIAATPKGEVVAVQARELVKYDSQGNLLLHLGGGQQDFIKSVGIQEFGADFSGLAVDSAGHLYLSTSENYILKLDENGGLIDRMPGVWPDDDLETIAVDGQGNIAWVYTYHPVLSDPEGRRVLGDFKSGFLSDAEFNSKGQLVGISRTPPQVETYTLAGSPAR